MAELLAGAPLVGQVTRPDFAAITSGTALAGVAGGGDDVMSRNIATARDDHAPSTHLGTDNGDAEVAALDGLLDLDATVTIAPEENQRLLAMAFAADENRAPPNTDDEITIDAPSPVPHFVARITQRPPALKALVLTAPPPPVRPAAAAPAVVSAPVSGFRPRITPELAKAARDLREAVNAPREALTATSLAVLEANPQILVVAGIWAMALSLFATLAFMVMA